MPAYIDITPRFHDADEMLPLRIIIFADVIV